LTAEPSDDPEAMQTEAVVARIQGLAKNNAWSRVDPGSVAESIAAGFRALESTPPTWLTADLIDRVRDRLRRVQGRWRATPFHQTLELDFPARGS
jgi:hypothetical protein